MNKQPEFYSLEFYSDADFWAQADGAQRRTFIMPLSNKPLEFLAFGVLSPSQEVLFVARGQAAEHLGEFIVRMVQAQARVEFFARPPLPDSLLNTYLKDAHHDQAEGEPPPPPPVQSGRVVTTAGAQCSLAAETSFWPVGDCRRSVIAVPLPSSGEYLAVGLLETDDAEYHFRAPFVAWVTDLEGFTQRMSVENAPVEVSTTPPEFLQEYVRAFQERLSGTGRMAQAA